MTRSDLRASGIVTSADRLLGCASTPLTALPLPRHGTHGRIERLLEGLVVQARASIGAIFLADDDGALSARARFGASATEQAPAQAHLNGLTFGLTVHGAALDGHEPYDDATCSHPLSLLEASR